ncbi:SfnB family sulfur acquisition oxidoreductase [Millisia brevis]|uniref:SfnB family sulfur acquisition oxidoreductase n=1 Tax=Millisia brevis TaxID=264148 RepID=UPI000831956E|nr:SfnB family sulfur acquisition oxidoreductase [Millisia brevis]
MPTTTEEAVARATRLATDIAAGAAERDRDRLLPTRQLADLRAAGLLAITVPAVDGGPGLPPSTVAAVTAILAAADPNVAQIPHSHFVYLNLVRLAAPEALRRRVNAAILAGSQIANAQSERGGATVAAIATTLTPDHSSAEAGSGFLLNGDKFYCTGSAFADILAVLARSTEDAHGLPAGEYVAIVPADAAGVVIEDDWDALGQRTTASGTIRFRDVRVGADALIPRTAAVSAPSGYGAFAQLLHAAIDVGIAEGALAAAAAFVREKSRPWFEADVERAVDDPLTVQRFGELQVTLVAARSALDAAGRAVDRAVAVPGEQTSADASLAVAAAKVLADRAATEIPSALFEVAGTRSAVAGSGLDHFWRNGRTHTLHDPVRWKYQHLGRWVLRGEAPPLHGVI